MHLDDVTPRPTPCTCCVQLSWWCSCHPIRTNLQVPHYLSCHGCLGPVHLACWLPSNRQTRASVLLPLQAGQTDILIDNLPGYPDGLYRGADGSFYVTLVAPPLPGGEVLPFKLTRLLLGWLPQSLRPPVGHWGMVLQVALLDTQSLLQGSSSCWCRYDLAIDVVECVPAWPHSEGTCINMPTCHSDVPSCHRPVAALSAWHQPQVPPASGTGATCWKN
jgi:hypothetical protein